MNALMEYLFFREATTAGESNVFKSHRYTDASIEFKGTATAFEAEIEACIDVVGNPQWTTLCVVDENSFETLNTITKKGIYGFGVLGKNIRVKINSISGGNLTVVAKFCD